MDFWKKIPSGDNPPEILNAVIEVISGSRDKYEYKSEWHAFVLDRIIPSSVMFPVEYGFVPQTLSDDNDPLDIMVLSFEPLEVGCIVTVRVIGALIIDDEHGDDPKILSVLVHDKRFDRYHDIDDVNHHTLVEIQEFYETYKRLEPHKFVKFKEWQGAQGAKEIVNYSIQKFKDLGLKNT